MQVSLPHKMETETTTKKLMWLACLNLDVNCVFIDQFTSLKINGSCIVQELRKLPNYAHTYTYNVLQMINKKVPQKYTNVLYLFCRWMISSGIIF